MVSRTWMRSQSFITRPALLIGSPRGKMFAVCRFSALRRPGSSKDSLTPLKNP
jgi:hypothetical protein